MRRSILAVCSAAVLASYPILAQEIPKPRSSGPNADPRPARSYPRVPEHAAMDAPQVRHAMRETINGGLVGIISGSMAISGRLPTSRSVSGPKAAGYGRF